MGRRSRSKSPGFSRRREHHRDKERDREKDLSSREYERDRHWRKRSRSRERRRDGERWGERRYSRSRSRSMEAPSRPKLKSVHDRPPITAADLEGKTAEEQEMMKIMGFANFDTTKGKKVEGNEVGEVHVILKRKYRQYMNRKGGFNRPLDFVA